MKRPSAPTTIAALVLLLTGSRVLSGQTQMPGPRVLSTIPSAPPGVEAQPAQMSGVPLPVGDLPPGIVTVRIVRGNSFANIAQQIVELRVSPSGPSLTATTALDGRAQFEGLRSGDTVRATATVEGEVLESQTFQLPSESGVRLMLVAGAGAGADSTAASEALPGRSRNGEDPTAPATSTSVLIVMALLVIAFIALTLSVVLPRRRGARHVHRAARG